MEDTMAARYWCHMCSQMVNPVMEVEMKCPFCQSGFVEEMSSGPRDNQEFESDRALSLWAPILLGMMGNSRRRRRMRRLGVDEDGDDNDDSEARQDGESEIERDLESIIRRRRRSSATIFQLLQGIRAGMSSEFENSEGGRERDRDRDRDRERDHVILINPFNQTIILQGSYDSSDQNQDHTSIGSLGDYFIGPGLDLLLQHLAENDPNRYGTPPTKKEAIEALPSVTINETLQCSVCLDDFETGTMAKQMPCKHKFHPGCILPWLELHSSCPVCRYQLPADESKLESERPRNSINPRDGDNNSNENNSSQGNDFEEGGGTGEVRNTTTGRRISMPWPFNGFFSSSSSQSSASSSSSTSSSLPGRASRSDQN